MKINNPIITGNVIINFIFDNNLYHSSKSYITNIILRKYGYGTPNNINIYSFCRNCAPLSLTKLYNELKQLK